MGHFPNLRLVCVLRTERDSWLDVLSGQRDEEEGVYEEWGKCQGLRLLC